MSEKAREFIEVVIRNKEALRDDEASRMDFSYDLDQTVAPLMELADKYAGHRMTCQTMKGWGSCDCGFDDAQKALKGWKE